MSKKHFVKRTLAGLLSALMVVTSLPATSMAVFAEEAPVETVETTEEAAIVETTTVEATSTEEVVLAEDGEDKGTSAVTLNSTCKVTINVDQDIDRMSYIVSNYSKPTSNDKMEEEDIYEIVDGKVCINVSSGAYLYIDVIEGATVKKNSVILERQSQYDEDYGESYSYFSLGQITQDITSGIEIGLSLRAEIYEIDKPSDVSYSFVSGYSTNSNPQYTYFDGKNDLKISVTSKADSGTSINKVELIPIRTTSGEWEDGEYVPGITYEDSEAKVSFVQDKTTSYWQIDKATLKQLMLSRDFSNWHVFKYMGDDGKGTLRFKIKVTSGASQNTVTFPGEESGVSVYLATLANENATDLSEKYSVETTKSTSTTVDNNGTIYFAVQVNNPTKKEFGSLSKESGEATLTQVDSNSDTVFYKLSGITSAVTLKAIVNDKVKKFKFILEDENNVVALKINGEEYSSEKEYTIDDFDSSVELEVKLKSGVTGYAIDKVQYKVGDGELKDTTSSNGERHFNVAALTGEDVTIKVTTREKAEEKTVTIDVDPDVGNIRYFVSKTATPTFDDGDYSIEVTPTDGKAVIKVENEYYLFIFDSFEYDNVIVTKSGEFITSTSNDVFGYNYYQLGQITKDTTGISFDLDLKAETNIEYENDKVNVSYASGILKNPAPNVYDYFDGKNDIKVLATPKTGYSIEKIELIPLVSVEGEVTADKDAVITFEADTANANRYIVDKATLKGIMRTKVEGGTNWKYMGQNDHNTLLFKIKVTTKATQFAVTLPTTEDDKGVSVHLATLKDTSKVASAANLSVEEMPATSATVDYDGTIYLAVQVNDPIHKVFGSMTKASGTATFAKVDSNTDTVFYKLSGVKSAVTLKATTTDKKAAGGAVFKIVNNDTDKNTIKVTGATYNKTKDEYTVAKNVTQIVVTVTTPAPYMAVRDLGEEEYAFSTQAPKAAGKNYAWTFTIPAVDITNPEGESGIEIPAFAFSTQAAYVSVKLEKDDEDVKVDSVLVGTSEEPVDIESKWNVPFGSTVTFTVSPKDNCKLTAAYVNGKKVALAGGKKVTFKATDLTTDTVKIESQKLLKTVVESGETAVTAKGTSYNVLKQNACFVYVKEGAEGKLDLTGKTITAVVGKDAVEYTVDENVVVFTADTIETLAGKTIAVTIKDGKKVVSTAKLVVSAKCTSVKVQGEKKVDGVDTIYLEMTSRADEKRKITYNAGVDPSDILVLYKVEGGNVVKEVDLDGLNILMSNFTTTSADTDYILNKEYELMFVDITQGGKLIATKKVVVTTKGFEKATPTVKVVSSDDTSVTLSITNPKINGYPVNMVDYTIDATQVVAKGKEPVAGMKETATVTQTVPTSGLVTIPLTELTAGNGKACNYSFEISSSLTNMKNVNLKTVTVKGATKTPAYEKNLKLIAKKTSFYQKEGEVLVAIAKFSPATTHTEDLKAKLYVIVDKENVVLADNSTGEGAKGGIRIDGTDIYVDLSKMTEYPATSGYYLEVEAVKDPNADKASSAKVSCTLLEPIKEIRYKYVSAKMYEGRDIPIFEKVNGKALTIAAPKVDFGKNGEKKNNPKSKSIIWSVTARNATTLDAVEGITIDPKTGKITIAKGVDAVGGIGIEVSAKPNDFEANKNRYSSSFTIYITNVNAFEVKVTHTYGEDVENLEFDAFNAVHTDDMDGEIKIAAKTPATGAVYTYYTPSADISIGDEGVIELTGATDNFSAVITVTETKGRTSKTSRILFVYKFVP